MRTGALTFLLLTGFFSSVFCANFGEIILVSDKITWSEAREYCRQHYTDLTSINSKNEIDELVLVGTGNASGILEKGWIGLYKNVNGTWMWSGGTEALSPFSEDLYVKANYDCVIQSRQDWQSVSCEDNYPFYCFNSDLILVRENKTWEAALEHCRGLDMQLVSSTSETALNQVLQTSRTALTAQVWTGLRYLGDSWLWVDGTCAGFETLCQEGMPQCPASSRRCGALSLQEQQLDSWDCADKLNFVCY